MSAEPATVPEASDQQRTDLHAVGASETAMDEECTGDAAVDGEEMPDGAADGEEMADAVDGEEMPDAAADGEATTDRAVPGDALPVITVGLSDDARERHPRAPR